MPELANLPMGRLDAFDIGEKKLTIQTEFFPRPAWRFETKVYLAGAVKKVYTLEISEADGDLQIALNRFHQAKMDEIAAGLQKMKQ